MDILTDAGLEWYKPKQSRNFGPKLKCDISINKIRAGKDKMQYNIVLRNGSGKKLGDRFRVAFSKDFSKMYFAHDDEGYKVTYPASGKTGQGYAKVQVSMLPKKTELFLGGHALLRTEIDGVYFIESEIVGN